MTNSEYLRESEGVITLFEKMKAPIKCTAATHSIFIRSDGATNACCHASWVDEDAFQRSLIQKETPSLENHFSSNKTIEGIKDSLNRGEFPPECTKCQKNEQLNLRSLRQRLKSKFGEATSNGALRLINIEIGNICNFRCLYCGPIFSNSWTSEAQIQEKHGLSNGYLPNSKWLENPNLIPFLIKRIQNSTSEIVEIEIVGGEPFLSPFHDLFLSALIESNLEQRVSLLYSSNFSLIKQDQIELLKKFPHTELLLSIDTLNPQRFNYIRFPGNLDKVLKNFQKLRAEGIFVRPFITIHALNVQDIADVLSWSIEMNIPPAFNFVDVPSFFHLSVASKRVRDETISQIQNLSFSRKDQLISNLEYENTKTVEEITKLKAYLDDLDQARGISHKKLFSFM